MLHCYCKPFQQTCHKEDWNCVLRVSDLYALPLLRFKIILSCLQSDFHWLHNIYISILADVNSAVLSLSIPNRIFCQISNCTILMCS